MLTQRWPIIPTAVKFAVSFLLIALVAAAPRPRNMQLVAKAQAAQQQAPPLPAPANPSPLYVDTFIDLLPQNFPAGVAAIKQYVLDTRKDPGNRSCIAVAQVAGRANHLIVMEEWQDEAAYHRHEAAQHTLDYRAKMLPLIGAPFDEREHFLVQ